VGVDYVLATSAAKSCRRCALPRFAHRNRCGQRQGARGLADDLRRDRHPVHGVEHDLPARRRAPARLAGAKQLLLIGDAFNYFCSGVARNEVSLASTTQLYNPQTKTWSKKLFRALGLREELFAPLCPSGTRLAR